MLVQLADNLVMDLKQFELDLQSQQCQQLFEQQLQMAAGLGISSYPSLVFNCNESNTMIHIDYNNSETIISSILALT